MALPIIQSTLYNLTLPSDGKSIKYRPFLVKEEKILLMALQTEDQDQMLLAMKQIVNNCTLEQIDVDNIPTFDLEYIFLNIRAKSVGEIAEIGVNCTHCGTVNEIQLDLTKIEVTKHSDHSTKIQLNDEIGIVMKYPVATIIDSINSDDSDINKTFSIISSCIDYIYDADNVYPAKESTKEELQDFIESLNTEQFEKLNKFFETIPKLEHRVMFKCKSCENVNEINLEGLENFFV